MPDLARFDAAFDRIGDLAAALGSEAFASTFFRFFDDMLAIDHCAVFAFDGAAAPLALLAEGGSLQAHRRARLLAGEYTEGAFTQDPVIRKRRGSGGDGPSVERLRTGAIEDCAFRRHFYDEQRIAEELHIVAAQGGLDYYVCFFRNAAQPSFAASEIEMVERYAGLALRVLRRQMELSRDAGLSRPEPASAPNREALLARMRRLLADARSLTARECEVCAHIALGYAVEGIALKLGISVNTVTTHRKRAYAKLGISSQNELFARCLDSVAALHLG